MFTGIIFSTAPLVALQRRNGAELSLASPLIAERVKVGDSLAVNGVCLTVARMKPGGRMMFHLSQETMGRSNLGDLTAASILNLELPLRVGDFLGGHWLSGHIDGTVRLRGIRRGEGQCRLSFTYLEREWRRFLLPKGSVALNGVSLTLVEVHPTWFSVEIIPHTWEATNLRFLKMGERANIELDFIGKYLYNFSQSRLK